MNRNIRKIMFVFLIFVLLFTVFVSCGKKAETDDKNQNSSVSVVDTKGQAGSSQQTTSNKAQSGGSKDTAITTGASETTDSKPASDLSKNTSTETKQTETDQAGTKQADIASSTPSDTSDSQNQKVTEDAEKSDSSVEADTQKQSEKTDKKQADNKKNSSSKTSSDKLKKSDNGVVSSGSASQEKKFTSAFDFEISPYSIYNNFANEDSEKPQFGTGVLFAYKYCISKGFYIAVRADIYEYLFEMQTATALSALVSVGYLFNLSEKFAADLLIGVGVHFHLMDENTKTFPLISVEPKFDYKMTEHVSISIGTEAILTNEYLYVSPILGVQYFF